jgi:hypothetical protein
LATPTVETGEVVLTIPEQREAMVLLMKLWVEADAAQFWTLPLVEHIPLP